jgi:CTP synthase (UTP-ammonia lyase)
MREKMSMFCNVPINNIIAAPDVSTITFENLNKATTMWSTNNLKTIKSWRLAKTLKNNVRLSP